VSLLSDTFDDFVDDLLSSDVNLLRGELDFLLMQHLFDSIDLKVIHKTEIEDNRNVSVIIGLNSDYEKGEFHFPFQDYTTTVKRGEAIVFPVYFMYPHFVDEPIGNRYTINTWMIG